MSSIGGQNHVDGTAKLTKFRRPHAPASSLLKRPRAVVGLGEAVAEYQAMLVKANNKDHSVASAMGHLRHFAEWLEKKGLNHRDIAEGVVDEYVIHRMSVDKVGDICRRRDVIYIKAFVKMCVRRGYLVKNALDEYPLPTAARKLRKMPALDESARILRAVTDKNKPENNPCRRNRNRSAQKFFTARDQAIIAVGMSTGMRISEILALRLGDYDRASRQLTIRRSKALEPRHVAVEPDLETFIDAWLAVRPDEEVLKTLEWFVGEDEFGDVLTPTLFVADNGRQLVQNAWGRQFKRYCEWAGVENVTFHCLRHYAGTQVVHVDAVAAMNQLGHHSLRQTMGYHHNDAEHVRSAVNQARPLGKVLDSASPKRRKILIRK